MTIESVLLLQALMLTASIHSKTPPPVTMIDLAELRDDSQLYPQSLPSSDLFNSTNLRFFQFGLKFQFNSLICLFCLIAFLMMITHPYRHYTMDQASANRIVALLAHNSYKIVVSTFVIIHGKWRWSKN